MDLRRFCRPALVVVGVALLAFPLGAGAQQQRKRPDSERRAEAERVLRTYLGGWETGDPAIFDQVLAPDFVDYMYGQLRTREALLRQAAAPRLLRNRVTIDDLLLDGDLAVVRVTNHFTHPESGRTATMTGMIIARIAEGKMVEGWGVHDRLGLYQQLGVIPDGPELTDLLRERLQQR